jgi:hypothetical protein
MGLYEDQFLFWGIPLSLREVRTLFDSTVCEAISRHVCLALEEGRTDSDAEEVVPWCGPTRPTQLEAIGRVAEALGVTSSAVCVFEDAVVVAPLGVHWAGRTAGRALFRRLARERSLPHHRRRFRRAGLSVRIIRRRRRLSRVDG